MVGEVADRADNEGVDEAAGLVDGQVDQAGVSRLVGCARGGGVGGAEGQDGEGGQGEGGESVPGVPAADLVLVEADLAFRGLEAFLDRPADPGHAYELGQAGRVRGPAAVEGQFPGDGGPFARMPCSRMTLATVFSEQAWPRAFSSAAIRGLPYRPLTSA